MSNCHSFLLKFTYQAWIVSGHVCVSYRYRLYLYFYVCVIFIANLPRGSLMRTYLISIIHKQRYFISSGFDMYCGDNIPFWRWLKLNQTFSTSVTCSDCDGEKLSNLQANNVTGKPVLLHMWHPSSCHSWFKPSNRSCIRNDQWKLSIPHSWSNIYIHKYATFPYIFIYT